MPGARVPLVKVRVPVTVMAESKVAPSVSVRLKKLLAAPCVMVGLVDVRVIVPLAGVKVTAESFQSPAI